jgi:hypothetical protein
LIGGWARQGSNLQPDRYELLGYRTRSLIFLRFRSGSIAFVAIGSRRFWCGSGAALWGQGALAWAAAAEPGVLLTW